MVSRAGLVDYNASNLHAECREPERAGSAPASPAAGIAPNFATRDALAEAPLVADRSTAVGGGTVTSRDAPDGNGERAARRRG